MWPVLHLDMGDCQAATVEEFWDKVETPTDVYLIEFKLDDTAANAIAQIREKDYAAPFVLSQTLTLIGLGFSSEQRMVTDSAVEAL